MKNSGFILGAFAMVAAPIIFSGCKKNRPESAYEKLHYLPFPEVTLTDEFWKPIIERTADITVPHNIQMCLDAGYVDNFAIVAGLKEGDYKGLGLWGENEMNLWIEKK